MKIKDISAKALVLIAVFVIAFLLNTNFSRWVYQSHEAVVNGILGTILIVMILRYISSALKILSNTDAIKFVFLCIFFSIVGYWATRHVIDMIIYLVKLL